jgi:hypothetical protein
MKNLNLKYYSGIYLFIYLFIYYYYYFEIESMKLIDYSTDMCWSFPFLELILDPTFGSFTLLKSFSHYVNQFVSTYS